MPGPPPRGNGITELLPRGGEDLCYLSGDWRIFQRLDGHRWSLDDLVTAWVAAGESRNRGPQSICDLGCGIGSVLLMMAWRFPQARLVGVEAQAVSLDLARRSIAWNGAAERCEVRAGDLRDSGVFSDHEIFDLVTGTPPYLPLGSASESRRIQWGPCHFEHRGGVDAYLACAARILARNGAFVMCAAWRDAARVDTAAATSRLAIVRRVDVIPRAGKGGLFSVYVFRRGNAARATCHSELVVRDREGKRTPEFVVLRDEMGLPP